MPRLRLAAAVATILVAIGLSYPSSAGPTLGQREVEEALTCQCGCGLTVASCNHLECSFAVPARKRITESLARGEPGEQIIDDFKREYGEKVLSSPVPEGFNLLAWIGPYLAIFVAGSLMFTFFRRRPPPAPPTAGPSAGPASSRRDARLAQLQDEVKELER